MLKKNNRLCAGADNSLMSDFSIVDQDTITVVPTPTRS
jgi:hypothetical protein